MTAKAPVFKTFGFVNYQLPRHDSVDHIISDWLKIYHIFIYFNRLKHFWMNKVLNMEMVFDQILYQSSPLIMLMLTGIKCSSQN